MGVDRFRCRGKFKCQEESSLEIAFWSESGIRFSSIDCVGDQEFSLGYYDAVVSDTPLVSSLRPVAIRVGRSSAELVELSIERLIEYHLRPHDDRSALPTDSRPRRVLCAWGQRARLDR